MPPPQEEGEPAPTQAQPDVRQQGVEAAERIPSDREAQRRAEQQEAARLEAARREAEKLEARRQEAARVEAARLEAERQEAARSAAARLEAQRQEAARLEAARVETARLEAARLEAERKEAARLAAAKLEAQRQEAARQEAARLEAARLEAERQEAVRSAAAKLEAQRQDAARLEAAHLLAEQEEDARREARRRAMGRQLEEAAARRQAAANAGPRLPLSLSTARRVRLWGRADPNVELVQYAEAWARKIQLNTSVDTVREVAKRPHTDPMVTVAIRSDGSVESVSFVLSSGVAEVDEAIRRIVQGLVPYPAFPPGLARDYDVVEVRRTWHFDMAVRLY
jgi:TolA protein